MDVLEERKRLDSLVAKRRNLKQSDVPLKLRDRLDSWKWGSTGWISPANLIVTAAWRKVFYPTEDCCKIWARDALNNQIEGGYSIRTADESITVPVFAKYDLCTGFCSSNSGMQGSRAIEKSRAIGRINRGLQLEQRTVFDSGLFADILNDINELSGTEANSVLAYVIEIAYRYKDERSKTDAVLRESAPMIDLLDFASIVKDPEFIKCVAAACFATLYLNCGFQLTGIDDHKTASDGRSIKAGDLTVVRNGKPTIAIEVKDRTRKLDWQNLNAAHQIIQQFPHLESFCFILESRKAAHDILLDEMAIQFDSRSANATKISFIALPDLIGLTAPINGYEYLVRKTAEYVTIAPSIKPATKSLWIQLSSETKIENG